MVTLIGFLLALGIVQGVALPAVATGYATTYPELAALAVPYLVAINLSILGLQVACVAVYLYRSQSHAESGISLTLGRVFVLSLVFAAVILAAVSGHAAFVMAVGGPVTLVALLLALATIVFAQRLQKVLFSLNVSTPDHATV